MGAQRNVRVGSVGEGGRGGTIAATTATTHARVLVVLKSEKEKFIIFDFEDYLITL